MCARAARCPAGVVGSRVVTTVHLPAGIKEVSIPRSLLGRAVWPESEHTGALSALGCRSHVQHWSSPPAGAKSGSIPPSLAGGPLSGGLPGGGGSAEAFVKRLKKDLVLRQGVAHVLQEQFLVGSGDEQVSQWLRDEGCKSTLDQVRERS